MTIREAAEKALAIIQAHEEAAGYDAGFDAGEFSGPAHSRAADKEIKQLARETGFSVEEIHSELHLLYSEKWEQSAADDGPYGRII